jgi:hypothetical protein
MMMMMMMLCALSLSQDAPGIFGFFNIRQVEGASTIYLSCMTVDIQTV